MDAFVWTCCGKPPASHDLKHHAPDESSHLGLPPFSDKFKRWIYVWKLVKGIHRSGSVRAAKSSKNPERSDIRKNVLAIRRIRYLFHFESFHLNKALGPCPQKYWSSNMSHHVPSVIGHRSKGLLPILPSSSNDFFRCVSTVELHGPELFATSLR